jgi:putative ABC transport system permease protein
VSRRADADRSRLRFGDAINVGTLGLRGRRLRSTLTALGIAIGIAAMVAMLGVTASSEADLAARLDALGPNLLVVTPGDSITGDAVEFRSVATDMVARIGPVESVASLTPVSATVRRTSYIPEGRTGGIAVVASDAGLLQPLEATVADGVFLDEVTQELPVVVLGSVAAERLGIRDVDMSLRVHVSGYDLAVVGILDPVPLAPNIDRSAIIGLGAAASLFDVVESPLTIYVRTLDDQVDAVRTVLPPTVQPDAPSEVNVSRPSDLLAAQEATEMAFTGLLLGLGAVALLVGGVGIANVMVISVLERRAEIGVRRSLGATRGHIRTQFVVESTLLSGLGGVGGVAIGAAITVGFARSRGWVVAVPLETLSLGIGLALVIGALAGLYPAAKAARLDPAEAVRPTG